MFNAIIAILYIGVTSIISFVFYAIGWEKGYGVGMKHRELIKQKIAEMVERNERRN